MFYLVVGFLILVVVLLLVAARYRAEVKYHRRRLQENPFIFDLEKLTAKITVKRGSHKKTVQVTLLQLMDVISGEGKSLAHMAEDLTKILGLDEGEAITETEMRLVMLYAAPTIVDFHLQTKKVLPFGLDSDEGLASPPTKPDGYTGGPE
jgi:hypothetical protein